MWRNLANQFQARIQKVENAFENVLNDVIGYQEEEDDGDDDENHESPPPNDGVNENVIEFVKQIVEYPKTFTDFPLSETQQVLHMKPWHIRHAAIILDVRVNVG
jgi:hypothetical protein